MIKRFSKEVHLSECEDGMYVLWEDYQRVLKKLEIAATLILQTGKMNQLEYRIDKYFEEDDHK